MQRVKKHRKQRREVDEGREQRLDERRLGDVQADNLGERGVKAKMRFSGLRSDVFSGLMVNEGNGQRPDRR